MVAIVDELKAEAVDVWMRKRGRLGAVVTGLGFVVAGSLLGDSDPHGVTVVIGGLTLMALGWLAPWISALRGDTEHGIDFEATMFKRLAEMDEEIAALRASWDEQSQRVDCFLAALSDTSRAFARAAERLREDS